MAPGKWLFDGTLNCYMWLLQTRDNERVREHNESLSDGEEPKKFSHFFNSFFFAKLLESGRPNHKSVKRFAKKITSVSGNVFKLDKIIIPVNVGHSHWCLCVAYIQQRRIQYYDSMNGAGDTYLNGLKYYLQEEAKKWVGDPSVPQHLLDFDSWTLVPSTGDTPQQNNCSDCGVFTCTFANYISQNLELRFSQSNINHFRQRITYDLAYAVEEIEEISNR
jgi:sentrin-specific protease 1